MLCRALSTLLSLPTYDCSRAERGINTAHSGEAGVQVRRRAVIEQEKLHKLL